jgi:hypothetical protein
MSPIRQQAHVLGSVYASPPPKAIIGAAALLLVLAAAAHAGRYHDYSCRTPTGESAPVDGWSGTTTGVTFSYAENTCAKGGALVAALGDEPAERQANTDAAIWTLTLPSPETLAGATLWRAGDTEGGTKINATYAFFFSGPTNKSVFDECVNEFYCPSRGTTTQPLSSENRVIVPAANLGTHLYMTTTCTGAAEYKCQIAVGDAQGYSAVAYLYAADLVIEQTEGPTANNVSGPLTTDQPVKGTSDLIFSATDPGAGIYQALFNVDGNVVQRAHKRKRRALPKRWANNGRAAGVLLPAALSEIGDGGRRIRLDQSQQRCPSSDRERVGRGRQHSDVAGPQRRRPKRTGSLQRCV